MPSSSSAAKSLHPSAREVVLRAFVEGITPEPELTVSEWAASKRQLKDGSSPEPGQWRNQRTPYLVEIMDELSPTSSTREIYCMKGSQVGFTECGLNWSGFVMDVAPGPFMFVMPTLSLLKRTSRQKFAPMIDATPSLRRKVVENKSRKEGNTTFYKEFPGGFFQAVTAGSANELRNSTIQNLYGDEIEGWEDDVDGEGDPWELAYRRTANYSRTRKAFGTSTPGEEETSRIEPLFHRGDQRYYYVPCPECGTYQTITWSKIEWQKKKDKEGRTVHLFETVHMKCEECGAKIPERKKSFMLENGTWVPTAEPKSPYIRSYHLSALYSPYGWFSWQEAAEKFVEAEQKKDQRLLKVFVNTVLGETWKGSGEGVSHEGLLERREKYKTPVPRGAVVLTCGVDTHPDRLELEVVGWARNRENWSIDYRVIPGDPDEDEVWEELDQILERKWKTAYGTTLQIAATAVDTGGQNTRSVYLQVRKRRHRRVYAIRGVGGAGLPAIVKHTPARTGRANRPVDLWSLGVDELKGTIYRMIEVKDKGAAYCHFPLKSKYTEEHFKRLTAEKTRTKFVRGRRKIEWYLPSGRRNEQLDNRVYSLAALILLDPDWDVLGKTIKVKQKAAAPKAKSRGKKRNYVTDYEKKL